MKIQPFVKNNIILSKRFMTEIAKGNLHEKALILIQISKRWHFIRTLEALMDKVVKNNELKIGLCFSHSIEPINHNDYANIEISYTSNNASIIKKLISLTENMLIDLK